VGGYGHIGQSKISRTTDGGESWSLRSLAPNYAGYVQEIAFPDDAHAFAVTHGGSGINHVFRSTDGGVSWAESGQGVAGSLRLETIFFLDSTTGFLGGGDFSFDAALWKTTDAGGTWTPMSEVGLLQAAIQDMVWFDEENGVVAGFDGICRTTDGGQTWSTVLVTPILSLDFRDDLHGFGSSYFYPGIWATEDGGQHWEHVDTPWEGAPYDIHAIDRGFAICGNGSVVVLGREGGSTGIPGGETIPPVTRLRVSVWPNPSAGPEREPLVFGIQSPVPGPVEIRLYDVAGRLVDAMTHRVGGGTTALAWRGSGHRLAAGTYFFTADLAAESAAASRASGRFVVIPDP
jgi:photosystem II stability/assembly factor-like uncharacterized protein